ncbi:hypothetical protein PENTCL1PPCAC_25175, partial [Pristionchus entomophagus]
PLSDQSLIIRLLPVPSEDASSSCPRRRERFRCAFLSRLRLDHPPREVQFEISALRCDVSQFDVQSGCVICVARRLPEEANKVIALSLLLDADAIVHSVFTRNCSTHQGTFQQLVGGAFRAVVAPEYGAAAERLLATQCESPLELDLLLGDKQFRVTATSLFSPRSAATRLECTVSWCTVRKPSPAFQPQLQQQQPQQIVVPPPAYAGYETSPLVDPQDALSLVCSSVFGDENMNMPARSQEVTPTERVRKKPGPKKQSKPRVKKGAAAAAGTPQDSAVSSSTGDEKNSVLKSLLGAPIQHPPMPMEMHPAYYNPVMYQQPQQPAAVAQQQHQQQQMFVQQQGQPNGYMVDMQQAQQWQQQQQAHPQQQMYYQQQMAYQMPAAQPTSAPAPAPTNAKKRKASNENGEKKPRGRQSAAAVAEAQRAAALAAQAQQQQQQVYYQQNQMMQGDMTAAYRFDPSQQQQLQMQQMQQHQQWMQMQQPGTMNMQPVQQQMQPAQITMMQQSAAAQQQQQRTPAMQQGSEFVRMELRQSLQAKQMAGRPSPANAMDVAVGSVGSTGSTAGSGTLEYLSDLLSDAELETLCDWKLCAGGGNGCGFDLENDDYTRKVVQRLLS